jgi:small-conductance mechanosensitive channel
MVSSVMDLARLARAVLLLLIVASQPAAIWGADEPATGTAADKKVAAPTKVDVSPIARDPQIRERLLNILRATDWFADPTVDVKEGIVFLGGQTTDQVHRQWAGDLARNTQDVVAVVNRINVATPRMWDLKPAAEGLRELSKDSIAAIPFVALGLIILLLSLLMAIMTGRLSARFLRRRIESPLLRDVVGKALGLFVMFLGVYLVLRVVGLTRLALSVIGGTGLIGLTLGIAFRDITENFLASIFLSMQRPFRTGDLVEIAGILGYVQRLTIRATMITTLDGNGVQLPNAIVYKSPIRNFTSNPKRRLQFDVGIGYAEIIANVQQIAMKVLSEHPAVLKEPEPSVLVENLEASSVNLRVYFWIDGTQNNWQKVRSSVLRLVKRAFQDAKITMPDASREVIFPHTVPIRLVREHPGETPGTPPSFLGTEPPVKKAEPDAISTDAEGGLESNAEEIQEVAGSARPENGGANLLDRPESPNPGEATSDDHPERSPKTGSTPPVPKRREHPHKD